MRIKSSQPRKQRKFLYTAPLHVRQKMVSALLSKELREKFKKRSVPIHKNDKVKILRGDHKGKLGKVERVNLKKFKVYIEGIRVKKTDGSERPIPIHPSNMMITDLNLEDKRRVEILKRR
jgi:large subunit ribosomal protein L24